LWPASNAIASTGTPCAGPGDTNVCRSSRGTHVGPSPVGGAVAVLAAQLERRPITMPWIIALAPIAIVAWIKFRPRRSPR